MDVATTTVGLTDLKFRLVREDFADAVAWVARNLPTGRRFLSWPVCCSPAPTPV